MQSIIQGNKRLKPQRLTAKYEQYDNNDEKNADRAATYPDAMGAE